MWWISSVLAATWQVPADYPDLQAAFDSPAVTDGDVIVFGLGSYAGASISNGKVLTIRGAGFGTVFSAVTLDEPVLSIDGSTLVLEDLTIDGEASNPGLFIRSGANVSIRNTSFISGVDQVAPAPVGGACLNISASGVTVEDSVFSGCVSSSGSGGAIRARSGTLLTIRSSTLTQNNSLGSGGAIKADVGAAVTLDGVTIADNTAGISGGGISVDGTLIGSGGLFTRNSAGSNGGAISIGLAVASASIDGTRFEENTAILQGGAISAQGPSNLNRVRFEDNEAEEGGAIMAGADVQIRNMYACQNRALADNGHVLNAGGGSLTTSNLLSVNNGGGTGISLIVDGVIENSTLYDEGATPYVRMDSGTFRDNVVYSSATVPPIGVDLNGQFGNPPDVSNNLLFNVALDPAAVPTDNLYDDPGLVFAGTTCAGLFSLYASENITDRGVGTDPDGTPGNLGHLGGPFADGAWWGADADGDGALLGGDCDDNDPNRYPAASEVCDGIDNDCDQLTDDADPVLDAPVYYFDADGDGFAPNTASPTIFCNPPTEYVARLGDCDDDDVTIHAGAIEACIDGIDNDCDTLIDGADPDYSANAQLLSRDADGDDVGVSSDQILVCSTGQPGGYVPASNGDDCDDANPAVSPLKPEICDDFDNNCDGSINEGILSSPYYADLDLDGFGDPSDVELSCAPIPDRVINPDDCDDTDPDIHPLVPEVCDGIDQDCDGIADNGLATQNWYADNDQDGYGADEDTGATASCAPIPGGALTDDDCDDTNPAINPGATEVLDDGVDNNCDGVMATSPSIDSDGDGIPDDIDPDPFSNGDVSGTAPSPIYGCACSTGGPSGLWFGALLLAAMRRR